MIHSYRRRTVAFVAALALLAAFAAPAAAAAGPANDRIGKAVVIGSIPFTHTQDTTAATSSPGDPGYCFAPEIGPDPATVWFSYVATATGPLGATTFGSDYDTTLYVGTASGSGIDVIACGDDSRTLQSAVRFDAVAGQTYLFAVGASPFGGDTGGNLVFNLDVGPVAQVVDLTMDTVGTLRGTTVTFHGTVSCSAPATLGSIAIAELSQDQGTTQALGVGFADVLGCPGTDIPFSIEVPSEVGRFKPGPATAQFIYAACNQFECANETIDTAVTIVRG
jgi:hypothetical protein